MQLLSAKSTLIALFTAEGNVMKQAYMNVAKDIL